MEGLRASKRQSNIQRFLIDTVLFKNRMGNAQRRKTGGKKGCEGEVKNRMGNTQHRKTGGEKDCEGEVKMKGTFFFMVSCSVLLYFTCPIISKERKGKHWPLFSLICW